MKQYKAAPYLRFKGFNCNWEVKIFENLFDRITTKNKENNQNILTISAQEGLVNQKDYFKKNVSSKDVTGYYLMKKDDFAYNKSYSKGYPFGAIKKLNLYEKGVVSTLYICFRAKEQVSKFFMEQFFNSGKINKEIYKIAQEGARNHGLLNMSIIDFFKDINITIPNISEQQKIAEFLSSVDKKIQLLEKKKEQLELYKKGVMQKIFSREIRFKDSNGNSYPDWEEKKLGDIGEFKSSSVDKKIKEGEELVFLINYMNVYNHEELKPEMRHKLMRVSASSSQILSFNLKKGDILFTPSSETPYDIGRSSVIFSDLENTLYSYHLMRFRPSINLNLLYSHYFCNISPVLRQLSKLCAGSTRFTISAGNFAKVQIELPCLGEQKKIADFLFAIDKKIETTSTQIDKTKEFKKGLLQQMFV